MRNLTTAERQAIAEELLRARDYFAGRRIRVADYFNDLLIELEDDRHEEAAILAAVEAQLAGIDPSARLVAEIIPDEDD